MNQKQGSMEAEKSIHDDDDICPLVEDLPVDSDWDTWSGNAACFSLEYNGVFKIYAVNPNDCSCYHLVDFPFPDGLENDLHGRHSRIASCTMIGSRLYLIGRTNPKQHLSTELWIWDVSQAQKMKHRGERCEWKRGPCLNSAKDKVLAFSLGRDLYALDICRAFFPQRKPRGPTDPFEDEDEEEVRAKNPHDFECLKTSLNPEDPLPPWVPMPPLLLEKCVCPFFKGYCCVGDTKFILHILEVRDIVDRDKSNVLKGIEDRMCDMILTWHTFHLGDKRLCCLAFSADKQQRLQVWICTLDLEKKSRRRRGGSRKKNRRTTTFSASNDVEKIWRIGMSFSGLQWY